MNIAISASILNSPLVAILGSTPPDISAGYSDWENIDRPKRKSVVNWKGIQPFQMTLNAMFDGWTDDTSVEPQCSQLESLALAVGSAPPPSVRIDGPIPHSDLEWYISAIDWGDVIYQGNSRVRQEFTLTLLERVDLQTVLNNEKKLVGRPTRYRIITVKTGYDLQRIATLTMGDSSLWRRITDMKGKKFRDPYVKPGTKIKVPIL